MKIGLSREDELEKALGELLDLWSENFIEAGPACVDAEDREYVEDVFLKARQVYDYK